MQRCLGCMREFSEEYGICPHCGYTVGMEAASKNHLAPGTVLQNRYTLGKVLGQGGFGITYIAWDNKIGREVAIKEYMPNALASRITGEKDVSCFNEEAQRQFDLGLEKTRKETHALSQFGALESVVKVYDCVEENKTAYIVMELLRGKTVKEILKERGKLSFAETMRIMTPVLQTLDAMHGVGMIHRDVAPDNIFVCEDGKIKLLDFGAARVVSGTDEKTLSVMLKAGYAPVEQYSGKAKQGTYTDVYAASATMYKMLTGETPPDSLSRTMNGDDLRTALSQSDAPQSAQAVILHGMEVNAAERIQSAKELLDALRTDGREGAHTNRPKQFSPQKKKKKALRIALASVLCVAVALAVGFILKDRRKPIRTDEASTESVGSTAESASVPTTEAPIVQASLSSQELEEKLKDHVQGEIKDFNCKDYNGDGRLEAFALVLDSIYEYEDEEPSSVGSVYFVSEKQVSSIDFVDFYKRSLEMRARTLPLTRDADVFGYSVIYAPGNHSQETVYCVDHDGNPKFADFSSYGSIDCSDYGWFAGFKLSYGDRDYPKVHKTYYTYYDSERCAFVEYGAVPLTVEQLYSIEGADQALEYIDKSSVRSVLFRANNIIHVNLERKTEEDQEDTGRDINYIFFLIDGKLTSNYDKYDEYWNSDHRNNSAGVILDCSASAFSSVTQFPRTYPDGKTAVYNGLKDFIQKYQKNYIGAHVPWYYLYEDIDNTDSSPKRTLTYRTHYLDVDADGEEECFLAVCDGGVWTVQLFDCVDQTVYLIREWNNLSEEFSDLLEVRQDSQNNVVLLESNFNNSWYKESVYDGTAWVDRLSLYAYSEDDERVYYALDAAYAHFFSVYLDEFKISESEYKDKVRKLKNTGTVVFSYGAKD